MFEVTQLESVGGCPQPWSPGPRASEPGLSWCPENQMRGPPPL